MKLWKKIYFVTLTVSVFLMNTGLLLAFSETYQSALRIEKERSVAQFQVLEDTIAWNIEAMNGPDSRRQDSLAAVIRRFENYYKEQDVRLYFWENKELVYAKEAGQKQFHFPEDTRSVRLFEKDGITMIQVNRKQVLKTGDYYLSMELPLRELSGTWRLIKKKYLLLSLGTMGALAVFLAVLLQRLMDPVRALADTVQDMAAGDYNSRAVVKGKDDIALLSAQFNHMADMIQENLVQIQEQAQKKQEFVDNFAHELKSPLTSIYGFAEYIEKTRVGEEEKTECMQFIMEESRRLLDLSYTLLDMAKLREHQADIAMEWFPLSVLYHTLEMREKKRGDQCPVHLRTAQEDADIFGNRVLLQSLVNNLVENATAACAAGGEVTVCFQMLPQGVRFIVQDSGCGMTPEEAMHIKEPFYRTDQARSRENGGTGLGLALCQKIVEVHHGKMIFASVKGKGTTVTVVIAWK